MKYASLGLALCAAACAESPPNPEWSGVVWDSAGIAMVENHRAAPSPTTWSVEADLTIEPDGQRPETLFEHIVDLDVDAAGRIYALDRAAREIRVFEKDGTYVGPIGGPGEGPGEFSNFAQSILVLGDALLVSDAGRRSLQRFALDGTLIATDAQPAEARRTWWQSAGGSLLYRNLAVSVLEDGRWGSDDALYRIGQDLQDATPFLTFDHPRTDIGGRGNPRVPYLVNTPTWTGSHNGGVAWTHLESDRVFVHGPAGGLERIVTHRSWIREETTLSDGEVMTTLMREKLRMLGGDPAAVDNLPTIVPERLPAITTVIEGSEGQLWVQRMGAVTDIHPMSLNAPETPVGWGGQTWDVLDAEGKLQQTLQLPERFRLIRIVGDFLYGVRRSPLDEEVLLRLRLAKSP